MCHRFCGRRLDPAVGRVLEPLQFRMISDECSNSDQYIFATYATMLGKPTRRRHTCYTQGTPLVLVVECLARILKCRHGHVMYAATLDDEARSLRITTTKDKQRAKQVTEIRDKQAVKQLNVKIKCKTGVDKQPAWKIENQFIYIQLFIPLTCIN